MTTKITIRRLMSMVPGNQPVTVKDYITGNTLEDATAEMFVEFIRNDCCVGFDGDYAIYGIQTEGDNLVFLVCPQEGIHYIEIPIYSEQPDENGDYEIIDYRREYV